MTNSFTSIHTNSSSVIDAITLLALSPGFLSAGALTFTYSGAGGFGSGVINVGTAAPSAVPLPGPLPLTRLSGIVMLFRRKKKAPVLAG